MTRDQFRPPNHPTEAFLLTTVVGSHPCPAWLNTLIDQYEQGDLEEAVFDEARDDATKAILADYERAGLDVVTDGEVRRTGMVEHFTPFIDGYDAGDDDDPADWNAHMPTVTDTVSSQTSWLADDFQFAQRVSPRPVKVTLPGPFTFSSFCSLDAYDDMEALIADFTEVVRGEVSRLVAAGVQWIQLDEPALGMSPHVEIARESVERISTAVPNDVRFGIHICSGNYETLAPAIFSFSVDEVDLELASDNADELGTVFDEIETYDIDVSVGVVDTQDKTVESVAEIKSNIRDVLEIIPPHRLTLTPDCGMKPLPRQVALEKVTNLTTAARSIEAELDAGRSEIEVAE